MGIPPSGNEFVDRGCNVFRVEGDKISECWGYTDLLGMMQQLGVIPPVGG